MRLGLVAAAVGGALLIGGAPTLALVAAQHDYSSDDSARRVQVRELRRDLRPVRPRIQVQPPRGDVRDRLEELTRLAQWTRCVLEVARTAKGPVDLQAKCGEPPPLRSRVDKEIPEKPFDYMLS